MDDKWFKRRQKMAGVTAEDIARELGKDRSAVSRIYVGRQAMKLDEAKVFAKVLDVPLADVLKHAGLLDHDQEADTFVPGFGETEVAPLVGKDQEARAAQTIAGEMGGNRPGVDPWQVKTNELEHFGYLQGDTILVDTNKAESCKKGDMVLAQIYDMRSGTAETVLRRYEPPVLLSAAGHLNELKVNVVDNNNVAIRGKIIGSWRKN